MTGSLNTTVNGSPGTCRETADWLKWAYDGGRSAADEVAAAFKSSVGWVGPAKTAYSRSMEGVGNDCDDLGYTAGKYREALLEFAAALDNVMDRMVDARMKAMGGDLDIEGPFILPPKSPGAAPKAPGGTVSLEKADASMAAFEAKAKAYAGAVADYNREVRIFNGCSELVQEARTKEDEAHANLRAALALPGGAGIDKWKIGSEALGTVLAYVESAENNRFDALRNAKLVAGEARTFQQLANGTLTAINVGQAQLLKRAGLDAGAGAAQYAQRAKQYERYLKGVPQRVRTGIAAYPGKKQVGPLSPGYKKAAASVAKRLPYAGSALVVGNELYGAFKGEQTWEKAIVKSGGVLAGAGVGAKGGAAVGALIGGPGGGLVGGLVGGAAGAIGGEYVVDLLVPDEAPEQPKAKELPPYNPPR